jgi:hypothetical protein
MVAGEFKYDVAISFLSADEAIAAKLYRLLGDGLEVFFYPRNQEDLAGTNGLETMRTPFLQASRLVVVLYREPWGETPWTRVEATAIQEGCLKQGWERLFFLMLDNTSAPPIWLPEINVRFNYALFGFEQALGAIRGRVQDRGGVIEPMTALRYAELAKTEMEFVRQRQHLRSHTGNERNNVETAALFRAIEGLCAEISARPDLGMKIEVAVESSQCHLRNHHVSLLIRKEDWFSNPKLVMRAYDGRVSMRGEHLFYTDGQPKVHKLKRFSPDLNRAGASGWEDKEETSVFLTLNILANKIVSAFIDATAKADRRRSNYSL